MILKSRKFPMRTEFLEFRRTAKRTSSPHFTTYLRTRYVNNSRLSVVIPKKVNKRATTRNWLKRLTYDTVWPMVEDENLDIVIIFKPIKLEKSTETKEQLVSEFNTLEF